MKQSSGTPTGQESYPGEQLGEIVLSVVKQFADVHRELRGKIETFNSYVMVNTMLAQTGVMPDFASAVAAPVAEPKPQAFMSGDS